MNIPASLLAEVRTKKYLNENSYSHEIGNIVINPLNASVASYKIQLINLHSKSIDWFL